MIHVVAMTREPDDADPRTWQIVTFAELPNFEVGDSYTDEDEVVWTIQDIFT